MSILASREHGVIPKSSTAVLTGGRVIHVRSDETVTGDRGNFGVVTEFKALPFTLLFLLEGRRMLGAPHLSPTIGIAVWGNTHVPIQAPLVAFGTNPFKVGPTAEVLHESIYKGY